MSNDCIVIKFKGRCYKFDIVDLGLPSGTKWGKTNIGARNPEDAGLYFSWGNVDGHAADSGYDFSLANYNVSAGSALTEDIPVDPSYDAAVADFSPHTQIPTKEQFQELYDNCISEHVTVNGVNGVRFTSTVNGNSIFFPAAGNFNGTSLPGVNTSGTYWASSKKSSEEAYSMYFNTSIILPNWDAGAKRLGFSIRPVAQNNN